MEEYHTVFTDTVDIEFPGSVERSRNSLFQHALVTLDAVSFVGIKDVKTWAPFVSAASALRLSGSTSLSRWILPEDLYSTAQMRTFRTDACVLIAFYFETADLLTAQARLRTIRNAMAHCSGRDQWKNCIVEDHFVTVRFCRYLEERGYPPSPADESSCRGDRRS
jgi:hypothetical protein